MGSMEQIGKLLLVVGLAITVIGAFLWLLGKLRFGGLPGDIRYESDRVRVYFPIVTCIVVSGLLTLIFWLWQWIKRG